MTRPLLRNQLTVGDIFEAVRPSLMLYPERLYMGTFSSERGNRACVIGWACTLIPELARQIQARESPYSHRSYVIERFADWDLGLSLIEPERSLSPRLHELVFDFQSSEMLQYLRDYMWLTDPGLDPNWVIWRKT